MSAVHGNEAVNEIEVSVLSLYLKEEEQGEHAPAVEALKHLESQ
jgi:hypothetical protein